MAGLIMGVYICEKMQRTAGTEIANNDKRELDDSNKKHDGTRRRDDRMMRIQRACRSRTQYMYACMPFVCIFEIQASI